MTHLSLYLSFCAFPFLLLPSFPFMFYCHLNIRSIRYDILIAIAWVVRQ